MSNSNNTIIISFSNDIDLAGTIFLKLNQFLEINNMKNDLQTSICEDEILILCNIDSNKKIKNDLVQFLRNLIDSYQEYSNYTITEFENILIFAIPKNILDISELLFCEFCGYTVKSKEELVTHRINHGNGFPMFNV